MAISYSKRSSCTCSTVVKFTIALSEISLSVACVAWHRSQLAGLLSVAAVVVCLWPPFFFSFFFFPLFLFFGSNGCNALVGRAGEDVRIDDAHGEIWADRCPQFPCSFLVLYYRLCCGTVVLRHDYVYTAACVNSCTCRARALHSTPERKNFARRLLRGAVRCIAFLSYPFPSPIVRVALVGRGDYFYRYS